MPKHREAATRRIDSAEWDRRRHAILSLHNAGTPVEGPGGIMAIMETQHGFRATPSQYELQFNKWKFRKYLHRDDWIRVIRVVDHCEAAGALCEVHMNGQLETKKWKLARRRYSRDAAAGALAPGAIASLPGCIEIIAATSHDCCVISHTTDEGAILSWVEQHRAQEAASLVMVVTETDNLLQSTPVIASPGDLQLGPRNFLAPCSFSGGVLSENDSVSMVPNAIAPCPDLMATPEWLSTSTRLPPLAIDIIPNVGPPTCGAFPLNRQPDWLSTTNTQFPQYDPILSKLLSSAHVDAAPPSTMLLAQRSFAQLGAFPSLPFQLLIRSIENNFAGLEGVSPAQILERLKLGSAPSHLANYLRVSPSNIAKNLAEKLLRMAIESDDGVTAANIIQLRALGHPDSATYFFKGHCYTAMQLSAELGSCRVAKALIAGGVSPNSKSEDEEHAASPLSLALSKASYGKYDPRYRRMIKLLLKHHCEVTAEDVWDGLCLSTPRFSQLIALVSLDNHSENLEKLIDCCQMEGLLDALEDCWAIVFLDKMKKACLAAGCSECFSPGSEFIRSAMEKAAKMSRGLLFKYLLPYAEKENDALLICAAEGGSLELVQLLLEQGADPAPPAIQTTWGWATPLSAAILSGNRRIVVELENRGALLTLDGDWHTVESLIDAAAETGDLELFGRIQQVCPGFLFEPSPQLLSLAIMSGREDVALNLMEAGAPLTYQSESKYPSPLRAAVEKRSEMLVGALLQRGALLASECGRPGSPDIARIVTSTVSWGNLGVLKQLISLWVHYPMEILDMAAVEAIQTQHLQVYRFLVSEFRLILTGSKLVTTLLANCLRLKKPNLELVSDLLDLGASPALNGSMDRAVRHGGEILEAMLRAFRRKYPTGKPNFKSGLSRTIGRQDTFGLCSLINAGFDINAFSEVPGDYRVNSLGISILGYADNKGLSIVDQLLKAGAKLDSAAWVEAREPYRHRTPLLLAIQTRNRYLVKFLLDRGADPHQPAIYQLVRTPLQEACEAGSVQTVGLLLDCCADVNESPAFSGGATSLQLCAIKGDINIAQELLCRGADVHAPGAKRFGRTALEGAAENGRLDMISWLWENSGAQSFELKEVERAVSLAEKGRHFPCCDLLQELFSNQQPQTQQSFADQWSIPQLPHSSNHDRISNSKPGILRISDFLLEDIGSSEVWGESDVEDVIDVDDTCSEESWSL